MENIQNWFFDRWMRMENDPVKRVLDSMLLIDMPATFHTGIF